MTDEAPPIPPGTGARIKARREQLQLTQAKVADRVAERVGRNYREGWLAQIERGKASMLLNAAVALADVLSMSLDEMLGRTSAKVGPDIVLEAEPGADLTQPLDDALAPVETLPTGEAAVQTRQAAAQRRQKRAAARPRST
jgi:transcriptional regulator with XRE-family HTH domain